MKGTFQREYIERCVGLGAPLNKKQIVALENVIRSVFGVPVQYSHIKDRNLFRETGDLDLLNALMSRTELRQLYGSLGTRVFSTVGSFLATVKGRKGVQDAQLNWSYHETNRDALNFYNYILAGNPNPDERCRVGRQDKHEFFNFGVKTFRVLEDYLLHKKVLEKEKAK